MFGGFELVLGVPIQIYVRENTGTNPQNKQPIKLTPMLKKRETTVFHKLYIQTDRKEFD